MKKVIHITILLLVYLLLCGKSCSDESNESIDRVKEVNAEKETISLAFETDWLNEEARHAQEMAAIQKMADLADYLQILSDDSIDTIFRNKAAEMIRDVFVSDEALLSFAPWEGKSNKKVTVRKLLDNYSSQEVRHMVIRFDSVRVMLPLQKTSLGNYRGLVTCLQQSTVQRRDTLKEREALTVEVVVKQRDKVFGPDTLKVWESFLGDMKIKK